MNRNIYRLQSPTRFDGQLITLKNNKSRLLDYFILDRGSDEFLSYSSPEGTASEGMTVDSIMSADFLASNTSIPIFSDKARKIFTVFFADEITFFPITIKVDSAECHFFLAKTHKSLPLIDLSRSSFRPLTTGETILERPVFHRQFATPFLIARDVTDRITAAVSQAFFDLCRDQNLDIEFLQLPQ